MSINQALDSLPFPTLEFLYDRTKSGLIEDPPRLTSGLNVFVTPAGTISRRPGTLALNSNAAFTLRADRMWIYETLDTPPVVYLVVSAYNSGTSKWELWYQRLTNSPGVFTQVPAFRDSNLSTYAHEAITARGLLFVKGIPAAASTEKLGTFVFDGTAGTVALKPWGTLGPTTPAAIVAAISKTTSAITATGTTLSINTNAGLPAAPFLVMCEYEQMNVTAISGAGPYNLTVTRGYGGTTAASHAQGSIVSYRNWNASAHAITVNFRWQYSYCYKDILGQYSNRAPVETNPDNKPSATGPFFNLIPQVTLQGLADTTNYPKVVVLRSTDGGGTWYILEEVANPGAGAFTYSDTSLTSGAGNLDPLPDTVLARPKNGFGPSLTSNSPPPTVNSPLVVGTDAPAKSTPLAYHAGRIWYAVGNIIYFSAQEEINVGVPESSFPSGLNGNFFRLQNPVINFAATSDALYVFTLGEVLQIIGTNLQTFTVRPRLQNYGAPYGHPRAIVRFGENVAFLTHDYRVAIINSEQLRIISNPLYTDLTNAIEAGNEVEFKYMADVDKQHLIVAAHNLTTPTLSQQWVYDINRSIGEDLRTLHPYSGDKSDFWFPPWNYPSTCLATGRMNETSSRRRLMLFSWNGSNSGKFAYLDPTGTTATDAIYGNNSAKFDLNFSTSLFTIPPGNHVNRLRVPYLNPSIYSIQVERTTFAGDTDPDIFYYADDLFTNPIPCTYYEDPARRDPSIGYKTIECPINKVAHRVGLKVQKLNIAEQFEVQQLIFVFSPDSGA